MPQKMSLEGKLDWERFQATARNKHALDARRFFRWRNFIDYNGGHLTDQGTHRRNSRRAREKSAPIHTTSMSHPRPGFSEGRV